MAKTAWSVAVTITVSSTGDSGDDPGANTGSFDVLGELVDELTEQLRALSASVGVEEDGAIAAQLTVDAGTWRSAADQAVGAVQTALAESAPRAGATIGEVREIRLLPQAVLERQLTEPSVPPLIGIAAIADRLHISRQRAYEVADKPEFPRAIEIPGLGRAWLETSVDQFDAGWDRRRTGRPRKNTAAEA